MTTESSTTPERNNAPPRRWPRLARRLAAIACVVYLAWGGAVFFRQTDIIFPRQFASGLLAEATIPNNIERLWLDADGAHVEAWLRRPDAITDDPSPLVVFLHGNAELIDNNLAMADAYAARGWAVLMPEYRGYGRSTGQPGQDAIVTDALAFINAAVGVGRIDASRIAIHGRSIGGGVAAQVAARLTTPPAALILESSFTSVAGMAWGYLVPPFLVKHPFRTDRVLPTLNCPILLLHGQDDTIIPPSHSRSLAKVNPKAVLIELPGGHNDFPRDRREYWRQLDLFLARAVSTAR